MFNFDQQNFQIALTIIYMPLGHLYVKRAYGEGFSVDVQEGDTST